MEKRRQLEKEERKKRKESKECYLSALSFCSEEETSEETGKLLNSKMEVMWFHLILTGRHKGQDPN